MNETRGNSRTKQAKNPIFPENFTERELLKERENHSLKDSEKTTGYNSKVKTSTKTKKDKWTPAPKNLYIEGHTTTKITLESIINWDSWPKLNDKKIICFVTKTKNNLKFYNALLDLIDQFCKK